MMHMVNKKIGNFLREMEAIKKKQMKILEPKI